MNSVKNKHKHGGGVGGGYAAANRNERAAIAAAKRARKFRQRARSQEPEGEARHGDDGSRSVAEEEDDVLKREEVRVCVGKRRLTKQSLFMGSVAMSHL